MSLRSLFRRKSALAVEATPTAQPAPVSDEPLSPEALQELESAWAELEAAAKESGVKSVHACSRLGEPWQKDPSAVRVMAGLIRSLHPSIENSDTKR